MSDLDRIKPLIRHNSSCLGTQWPWLCTGQMAWGFGDTVEEAYAEWLSVINARPENERIITH
jgi:hypothetical protein